MLWKIIWFCFLVGLIILCLPSSSVSYQSKVPVEGDIKPKTAITSVKKVKVAKYAPPQGKPLEIALYVSQETGIDVDTISKIMWSESRYSATALNVNKNGTKDFSYFQINEVHRTEAEKMGLDIEDPEDNVEFAIHLIKEQGLTPWNSSQEKWLNL